MQSLTLMVWFKSELDFKKMTIHPQFLSNWGSNSWPLDHDRTFHVTETLQTDTAISHNIHTNKAHSKMPTVRNARSLVTSRELPSGLQIWMKSPLNALFSVGTMNADTDSASEESVKVIQGRVAHGTLYVRLTCPTMDNRHNKLSQVPEF